MSTARKNGKCYCCPHGCGGGPCGHGPWAHYHIGWVVVPDPDYPGDCAWLRRVTETHMQLATKNVETGRVTIDTELGD